MRTLCLVSCLLSVVACSRKQIDLSGLACGDAGCIEGYSCDEETGLCVTAGDACADEGRQSPCVAGETDCSQGCRTCTGGVWSECETPQVECSANEVLCDGTTLVTCDAEGNIDTTETCEHGCNSTSTPPQCNVCDPGTTVCETATTLVACDATGSVRTPTNCPFGCNDSGTPQCNVCAPSTTTCDTDDNLVVCDATGLNPTTTPCPFGCNATSTPPVCRGCEPATTSCDASDNLVVCDAGGNVVSSTPCPNGCNETAGRCDQCVASTTSCDASNLVVCDADGLVDSSTPCPFGCNASAQRCNDCTPSANRCDDLSFVQCGSDGLIVDTTDCTTTSGCTGVGTCDPIAGCGTASTAPDGTPCEGSTTSLCDSSCQDGECLDGVNPDCDDNNDCTTNACNDATGCTTTFVAINTGCLGGDADLCNSSCDGAGNCRASTPVDCDDTNPCTADACADGVCQHPAGNANAICRAQNGICDVEEVCTGSDTDCPDDTFAESTVECRESAGVCDPAELCTGSSRSCPDDELEPSSTECHASAGDCDAAEFCTGDSAACPEDQLTPSGTECRTSEGDCDPAEECTGGDVDCPVDAREPNTTECNAAAGVCDVAEYCDGGVDCPTDVFSTGSCGTPTGLCDIEDFCDGTGPDCPEDQVQPGGHECRAAADPDCDLAETCDGSTHFCPADQTVADDTPCGTGTCDVTELTSPVCSGGVCSGSLVTECNDGLACNGAESCTPGGCVPGSGGACDDGCNCSVETCRDPDDCQSSDFAPCNSMTLSWPSGSATQRYPTELILDIDCAGKPSEITCTGSSARYCVAANFEGSLNGFTNPAPQGTLDNPECDVDSGRIDPTAGAQCTDSDGGAGDLMRLLPAAGGVEDVAAESPVLDFSGWTDLVIHFKAAFANNTDNGEDYLAVRACCGGSDGCVLDGGNDVYVIDVSEGKPWAERGPYTLDTATFDDCDAVRAGFYWHATVAGTEMAHIDDFAISGIATPTLPVTDNGDGTYAVPFALCEAATVTITCTWDNPDGGNPSDSIDITFD